MTHIQIRRIFCLVLTLCMLLSVVPMGVFAVTETTSGYCGGEGDGRNLSWTLTPDGVLTISGTGKMKDYLFYADSVFYQNRDSIFSVIIEEGVTAIGVNAFYLCNRINRVVIPDGVVSIGRYAFNSCGNLANVNIPNTVTSIGEWAFNYCKSITSAKIPDGVTTLEKGVFYGCTSLESINIPYSVVSIGESALRGCKNMTSIVYAGNKIQWDLIKKDGYYVDNEQNVNIIFTSSIDENAILSSGHCGAEGVSDDDISWHYTGKYNSQEGVYIPDSAGKNISWTLDYGGRLRIFGAGEMRGYTEGGMGIWNQDWGTTQAPWKDNREIIKSIYFETGISDIKCTGSTPNVKTVYISDTVTTIHTLAFMFLNNLKDVYFAGSKEQWENIKIGEANDELLNATIHFNSYPDVISDSSVKPLPLQLVSAVPADNSQTEVTDSMLSLSFNRDINPNLNWSAGSIKIKDRDSKATVLEINNKNFYTLGGNVIGDTISIPYAFKDLEDGHYYITIDKNLIWAADKNTDGSISKFAGLGDEECYEFVYVAQTEFTINFRGTEMNVNWDWEFFNGDATKKGYQQDLAIVALALSGAAENNSPENVESMLSALGYSDISSENYGTKLNVYNPAVTFASTEKVINGENKTIIAVVVRGTNNISDGITDVLAAGDGFAMASINTNLLLWQYLDSYCSGVAAEDLILLITGHSYGGAVAGTLPVIIDYAYKENIFVYTFASPNHYTADRSSNDFTNVFNIIHSNDGITNVPLEEDYSKVGVNLYYTYYGLNATEKSSFDVAYQSLKGNPYTNGFITNHVSETYMAFLLSSLPTEEINEYFTLASVHCPVDVEVYDETDDLVASVEDNIVRYYGEPEVLITVDGDEKYIYMPYDRDFRIELMGTDTGAMDYVVRNVSVGTGDAVVEKSFSKVPLYAGKTMISEVDRGVMASDVKLNIMDKTGNIKSEVAGKVNGNTPFNDINPSAYYYGAVLWANIKGITTGTTATTFSPNDMVTRAQAVTFLWRAVGEPSPKTIVNPFTDVKESDYFYEAVLWAVENGITLGTSATAFSPKNTCSTAHMVTFLYRTLGIGSDGWYKEAAAWAEKEGLLTGTGANVIPSENCPRSNVVTFLYRELR